jgi:hypothetical protein
MKKIERMDQRSRRRYWNKSGRADNLAWEAKKLSAAVPARADHLFLFRQAEEAANMWRKEFAAS